MEKSGGSSRGSGQGSSRGQRSGDRNSERRNRSSKSPAKGGGFGDDITCLRCGSKNHSASTCPRYTSFCQDRYADCTLYHATAHRNQRKRDYKSPGRSSQKGRYSRRVEKITKRVNNMAVQEDEPIISVEQNPVASVSLASNLFRKN